MRAHAILFTAVLAIFLAAPASAVDRDLLLKPTAAQLKQFPTLGKLQKIVRVGYVDTPLESVMNHLSRLTETTIVLDRRAIGSSIRTPIDLTIEGVRASEALYWALRLANLDFEFRGKAVYVSTRSALVHRHVKLYAYNIRDLIMEAPNFVGPDLLLTGRTHVATTGASVGVGAIEEAAAIFEEGSLPDMIQNRIEPSSWAAELGTSIEERDGQLLVVQTPEIHAKIARFLNHLREQSGQLVTIDARVLRLSPRLVTQLFGNEVRSPLLSKEDRAKVDEMIALKQAEVVTTLRTTCYNKQQVYVLAGDQFTYIRDYDVAGSTYDPVVRALLSGAVLDVMPTIVQNAGRLKLKLRMQLAIPQSMTTFYPLGGPGPGEGTVPFSEFKPGRGAAVKIGENLQGPGALHLPAVGYIDVRTTVVVPDGATIFFSGADPQLADGENRREMIVLITPRIVEFKRAVK
jgi:hypothetical protein